MTERLDFLAYPLPEDLQRLKDFGDFERAEKIIGMRLLDPRVPEALKERLRYERIILRELPLSYPCTGEEAFKMLQKRVDGITPEEMEALRDDGTLDWIYVGGEVRYKDDCCASLVKTRPDLNGRILDKKALQGKYDNFKALDEIIGLMKKDGHARLRYRMRTTVTLNPSAQRPGETVRVHIALPLRDAQSVPAPDIRTAPAARHIAPEDAAQRTAFFEEKYEPGMSFAAEFGYDIDAQYVDPRPDLVSPRQPDFDTGEMPPHIQFTPFIRALARELAGEEKNPLTIARRFYDYVSTNAVYRYVRPYRTVTNIPEYFGAGLRGDCGMHALLFITLCRFAGIPAQWQAGWYARPGHVGSHDWARFYVAPYGWLFADGSFGGAAYREGHLDRWNFYFGNLEPWRMVSNRDFQQSFDPPRRFPRCDPYDSQSAEVEYHDRALETHEYSVRRETLSCQIIG